MPALVIDGHPNAESLCAALAERYAGAYPGAILLPVRDLAFDPILHPGYRARQEHEPDLLLAKHLVEESEHVVVVTPVWWASTPALLKGFFDRLIVPGWGFEYPEGLSLPRKLLTGRSGRLIVTSDSPRWWLPLVGDSTVRQVRDETMRFVGFSPVRTTRFTNVKSSTARTRAAWLDRVGAVAQRDAARAARGGRRMPRAGAREATSARSAG